MNETTELAVTPIIEILKIDDILPHHAAVARRLVYGIAPAHISDELGISIRRINIISKQPLFVAYMEKLRAMPEGDVEAHIGEAAPIAVEILERTMITTNDEKLKVKVAQDLLDRAGHGAIKKSDIRIQKVDTSTMKDMELMALINKRKAEIADELASQASLKQRATEVEIVIEEEYPDQSVEMKIDE